MSRLKNLLCLVLLVLSFPLLSDQLELGDFGSFIDLPEGWTLIGQESEKLTFSIAGDGAYLQIKRYPGEASLDNLVRTAMNKIGAAGDGTTFAYAESEAYFGTVDFTSGGFNFSGYLFACLPSGETGQDPVLLLGFSDSNDLPVYNDLVLSALDSYSPTTGTSRLPGPVALFDRLYSSGKPAAVPVNAGGINFTIELDQGEVDTAGYVTEREARILGQAGTVTAWGRFFRILYRDALSGLEPLIRHLHTVYPENPDSEESFRIASEILTWLQQFTYRRSGTYSDFLDPLQAVITRSGDCDSLGMLYALLLHSFDIDAILLVSEQYSHAMGAVKIPGEGARFTVNGTSYLVAELTDNVAIGLIAADMADPAGWIPVLFPESIRAQSDSWR